MSAEHERRVLEILQPALEREPHERDEFLAEACAGDAELRSEVESILASHEKSASFLDRPAAELLQEALCRPLTGERIGPYLVLEQVGRGGMGDVYLARDDRLGRKVALKLLRAELIQDPQRLDRFRQEASAASALNHPNILTIHEIGEGDDLHFMATEYIEGRTLRERMAAGKLEPGEAIEIAIQVTEALTAAHQAGFVHRDVKPENVMVRRDGLVKVLDFGLAKLTGSSPSETRGLAQPWHRTETAVVMGTFRYLSPEQARGERLDARSDIFSFGIVLYEMLTGNNPFDRRSTGETVAAILKESPESLSTSTSGIKGGALSKLQQVVDRCLARNAEERYPATEDLLLDLKRVRQELESIRGPEARGRKGRMLAASVVGALFLGTLGWIQLLRREPVPLLGNLVQVTRAIGAEAYPSWSPDGGRLVYHLDVKGDGNNLDVFVARPGGGPAVNLTADHRGNDLFASWSPDGSQIAFWSDRGGGGYFITPASDGPAREVARHPGDWSVATRPQWSPDGTELAFVVYEQGAVLVRIVSLASGASRQLPLPGREFSRQDLSWSPDGRYFAYVDAVDHSAQVTTLRVLRVEDEQSFSVTDGRSNVWSPSWSSDGRYLYFVSNHRGSMDLWRQRTKRGRPAGEPERVTTGIAMTSAAFSPDGKTLAYTRGRWGWVSNVFRTPVLNDRPASWADAEQITFDDAYVEMLDVSPDGKHLLVSSDRAGNPDLWMLPADGGAMEPITTDPAPDWAPAWSPDGKQVAFYAYRSGNREIWVQPIGGGPARQLTKGEAESGFPTWSPDGRQIAFQSLRGGDYDIWTVPAYGGEPRRLMTDPASDDWDARFSPDGKWLAFVSSRSDPWGLWRARVDGTEPEPLVGEGVFAPRWLLDLAPRWSPDGKWIYYVGVGERGGNIWGLAVDDRSERAMTDLRGRRGGPVSTALSTDGSYLYFAWQEDLGDIWVADVTYR